MSEEFWQNKLRAFLHDPPDKTLRIQDHVERRMELLGELKFYADESLPEDVNVKKELKNWRKYSEKGKKYFYNRIKRLYEVYGNLVSLPEIHIADLTASSLQRIDIEKIGDKRLSSTFYRKHGENYIFVGEPQLRHPITGNSKEYRVLNSILPKDETSDNYDTEFDSILNNFKNVEIEAFNELIAISNSFKNRYFVVWRYYPELLRLKITEKFGNESIADEFLNLTAYTLSPDHTLFDHADATSAIYGAICEGRKPALLMFKISPVQDFIKNARKERDLWAGSHLLSFLTFQAIKAVVDEFGPDAIVFPHLRGQPFFDKAYENYFGDIHIRNGELKDKLDKDKLDNKLKIANIPNKFLAIVGFKDENDIKELREKVVKSAEDIILEIFKYAWKRILPDESAKDSILNNVKKELTKLKEKAERENISRDVERYEKALKELEKFSNNLENYKACYQQLAEKYFRITLEILEVPFDNLGDRKESYRKLKEFVKSLGLPEGTESKYVEWIELLESFGTHPARPFDLYSLMFELLEEVVAVESRKFEKIVEFEKTEDDCKDKGGYKCSLCGEAEAICGENYTLMKVLWSEIGRRNPFLIKKNEHLCPICLVKRFYHEWLNEFEDDKKKRWGIETGFESVSKVALKKIARDEITFYDVMCNKKLAIYFGLEKPREAYWNTINVILDVIGLCHDEDLFYKENLRDLKTFSKTIGLDEDEIKRRINNVEHLIKTAGDCLETIESKIGEFPKYYAILIMDGDNMGKMLIGDEMKSVKDYLHPDVFDYLPEKAKKKVEKTKRLITPATHSAISRALAHFSIKVVPDVVNTNRGEIIYAGGDDVLALLPIDSALACAYEIQKKFGEEWDGWNVLPAKTMSGGILIVHYKHPLYDALDKARELEKKAKEMGRDCVAVGHLKRGGSYDEVVFNWSLAKKLSELIADYSILNLIIRSKQKDREQPYISERISYDVLSEIENLPNDVDAIKQFLKYELSRHYHDEKERKKRILEDLTAKIVECARRVRVTLSKEELESVLKLTLSKADVKKVNDLVKSIVREFKECENNCPDVKGSLRRGINDKKGLEKQFNITDEKIYEELDGLILKKQVKGLFILLKILVDCNEELRCSS